MVMDTMQLEIHAEILLDRYGPAIVASNIRNWRWHVPTKISWPDDMKHEFSKFSAKNAAAIKKHIRKILEENKVQNWKIYFNTGQRYARWTDMPDMEYGNDEDFNSSIPFGAVYHSKLIFMRDLKLNISTDISVHGLNDKDEIISYLKLDKYTIKSISVG